MIRQQDLYLKRTTLRVKVFFLSRRNWKTGGTLIVIPAGLGILAGEFVRARFLLKRVRDGPGSFVKNKETK